MPEPPIGRVWALFDAALHFPASQRPDFVAAQCAGDVGLLSEVLSLLEYHSSVHRDESSQAPTTEDTATGPQDSLPEFPGTARYVVRRRIGAGGFGVVYEVRDLERGSIVALKTLHNFTGESLFRFKREFRALADVTHPNLVQLYELGYEQQRWFFTMELVHGRRFLEHVWDGATGPGVAGAMRPFPSAPASQEGVLPRLVGAMRQLVEGLDALHRSGHLHRDIKPSNVLVTASGRVVLVDFGLALEVDRAASQRSLTIAGTPAYMSPEQGAGLALSPASDFYSVGVMLYESLTGAVPHDGRVLDVLMRKQQDDVSPPSARVAGIPSGLDELCAALLRRDAGSRPGADEILERLHSGAERTPGQSRRGRPERSMPFVGRERQLAALDEALEIMMSGTPCVASVFGASGIGKTALVRRFLENLGARHSGAVVLSGRCYEQESVPYKALDSLVDALARYLKGLSPADLEAILPRDTSALATLFPVLGGLQRSASHRIAAPADSHESRRRAHAAMRELLARLGDRHPLVLAVDDLQWGDVDSASLLTEVLRGPDPPVVLLLASYRDVELATSPFLRAFLTPDLTQSPSFVAVPVAPLDEAESAQLTATLMVRHAASKEFVHAISVESGGSPFFIDELVRFAEVSGRDSRDDAFSASADTDAREASLAKMIQIRLSRLNEAPQRLLRLVAVNGQPIPEYILRSALEGGLAESDLLLLRSEHLLRVRDTDRGVELEAYHDRIREVVVSGLSPAQLQESHMALAAAFAGDQSVDPELLAQHYLGARALSKAAQYTLAAARAADRALAFDRAARLYRQVLTLSDPAGVAHVSVMTALAEALINAGRGVEAADILLESARHASDQSLATRAKAAQQLLFAGQLQRGLDVVEDVLHSIGLSLPRHQWQLLLQLGISRLRVRVRVLRSARSLKPASAPDALMKVDACWALAAALSMVDTARGALFQTRHLLMAQQVGELERLHRALCLEFAILASQGIDNHKPLLEVERMLEDLAVRVQTPYARALHRMALATRDHLFGRWKAAVGGMTEAEELLTSHCTGVTWEIDTARILGLWGLYWSGDLNSARARITEWFTDARDRGDVYATTALRVMTSLVVYLPKDDIANAQREAEEAITGWSQPGFHNPDLWTMYASGQIALYRGRAHDAWHVVEQNWPMLRRSLLLFTPFFATMMADLRGRAALAVASVESDRETRRKLKGIAARCAGILERQKTAWTAGFGMTLRAGIAHLDDPDGAAERSFLTQAEVAFESADMRLFEAVVRRRRAALLKGPEADHLMHRAAEWMRSQQVAAPAHFSRVFLPWAGDSAPR